MKIRVFMVPKNEGFNIGIDNPRIAQHLLHSQFPIYHYHHVRIVTKRTQEQFRSEGRDAIFGRCLKD